jgi:hypothetical protein
MAKLVPFSQKWDLKMSPPEFHRPRRSSCPIRSHSLAKSTNQTRKQPRSINFKSQGNFRRLILADFAYLRVRGPHGSQTATSKSASLPAHPASKSLQPIPSTDIPDSNVMIGKVTILGALLVWLYTGAAPAKQAFAGVFVIGTLRFLGKWIQQRRIWSKYVYLSWPYRQLMY